MFKQVMGALRHIPVVLEPCGDAPSSQSCRAAYLGCVFTVQQIERPPCEPGETVLAFLPCVSSWSSPIPDILFPHSALTVLNECTGGLILFTLSQFASASI